MCKSKNKLKASYPSVYDVRQTSDWHPGICPLFHLPCHYNNVPNLLVLCRTVNQTHDCVTTWKLIHLIEAWAYTLGSLFSHLDSPSFRYLLLLPLKTILAFRFNAKIHLALMLWTFSLFAQNFLWKLHPARMTALLSTGCAPEVQHIFFWKTLGPTTAFDIDWGSALWTILEPWLFSFWVFLQCLGSLFYWIMTHVCIIEDFSFNLFTQTTLIQMFFFNCSVLLPLTY